MCPLSAASDPLLHTSLYSYTGIDSMKADQEKMLSERLEKLKKKLASAPANSEDKEKIQDEVEQVQQKLKRTVCA